ncbi:MAG: glycosyltransferase family 2 protein [Chloroflexi bacterium]|nr:glycosyltransferase family 2 protein [Chloroflexota bacterium]
MLIFVVPAYNEEENIGQLLENILSLGYGSREYRVIVVNDGSRDKTEDVVLSFTGRMPVGVVSHSINQGVGAVFRTGFDAALKIAQPSDVIVTLEADNTSDLAILPEMLKKMAKGDDLVLASCYAKGGSVEGTNFWRRLLSWGANYLLVLVFPIQGVKTYSSFYRAYNADALRKAIDSYKGKLIEQPGFVCMVEALVKMQRLGISISEVPMVLRIGLRKGSSKMRIMRTIRGYVDFIAADMLKRK